MFGFLKKLFGAKPTVNPCEEAPYKVEEPAPVKCGCGRSSTGYCVGLHKLTADEWAVHESNPNKAQPVVEKAPAKKAAPKKAAPKKESAPKGRGRKPKSKS